MNPSSVANCFLNLQETVQFVNSIDDVYIEKHTEIGETNAHGDYQSGNFFKWMPNK